MCPSSGENHYIYATLVLSLCTGDVWSADQMPPIQSDDITQISEAGVVTVLH